MPKNRKKLFDNDKMFLIVSLPKNEAALARAAVMGGAHALKVHINVEHAASGTKFGSLSKERPRIQSILDEASATGAVVGVMPGAEKTATAEELRELADMGARFYDIYCHDMPAEYLSVKKLEPMVALGPGFSPDTPKALCKMGVRLLEASFMPHEQYGRPLTVSDLIAYKAICHKFKGRVVVPTQKAIRPDELALLREAGVRGIMIGAIVTGATADSIREATAAFRKAIDKI